LHGAHDGAGVPAQLGIVPSIRLSRRLKLGLEIGFFLSEVGGKMAPPVAIHCAFAEAILSRNISERLSRFEAVVNGRAGRMGANGENPRHPQYSQIYLYQGPKPTTHPPRSLRLWIIIPERGPHLSP